MIPQQCTDTRYAEAVQCVRGSAHPCVALIQRKLVIGYNRAERLMQALIAEGVIERFEGAQGVVFKVR